ncbi:MAG: fatty acyl-AMP ligase [Gammaproteobacteria bacterium]
MKQRPGDFDSLAQALDYAALGDNGMSFYDGRGRPDRVVPYRELREEALATAGRLLGLGLKRGARVSLLAETIPEFISTFFACQYAGLIPVPLPATVNLGGRDAFTELLTRLLEKSRSEVCLASEQFVEFVDVAAAGLAMRFAGTHAAFAELEQAPVDVDASGSSETAYVQYTSGSTRFPRGAMVSQCAVMSNLTGILKYGVQVRPDDCFMSWLPLYHDMGLIGKMLTPVACQAPVNYLDARAFAMRPRLWPELMSRTGATISYGPPFGYELCTRRLRPGEGARFDLSRWRIAGVGAEMIRPDVLRRFAEAFAAGGFEAKAFMPSYGMAEATLALSFAPIGEGYSVDTIDRDYYAESGEAKRLAYSGPERGQARLFVDCGVPLPGYHIEIRDENGEVLPDRRVGSIFVRGPSLMEGYLDDPQASAEVLCEDRWLDTGDLGYRRDGRLVITGRRKDLIIVNGRNIWPQDLEYLAERQPGVRSGDALAFSVPDDGVGERVILLIQCREHDISNRMALRKTLRSQISAELAVACHVELVGAHALPRTSSGKLSRSRARADYLASQERAELAATS